MDSLRTAGCRVATAMVTLASALSAGTAAALSGAQADTTGLYGAVGSFIDSKLALTGDQANWLLTPEPAVNAQLAVGLAAVLGLLALRTRATSRHAGPLVAVARATPRPAARTRQPS